MDALDDPNRDQKPKPRPKITPTPLIRFEGPESWGQEPVHQRQQLLDRNEITGHPLKSINQHVLKEIPVAAVVVGERLRDLDEVKVLELMNSYKDIGIINAISVDEELNLIAGRHRLEAARNLGWETIEAKVYDQQDLQRELIEIDENLCRNELCYIGTGEHIAMREQILTGRTDTPMTKTHGQQTRSHQGSGSQTRCIARNAR
jgi:hypothetical protein